MLAVRHAAASRRRRSGGCSTAAGGHDGALLVDADGRRQLAGVLDAGRLDAGRDHEAQHGMPLHRLLAALDLADGRAPRATRHRDVDTWADLRDLAGSDWTARQIRGCGTAVRSGTVGL